MDAIRDTFRASVPGWLGGTLAGWGTILLGVAGFGILVAAAGDWGAWPLLLSAVALLIVLLKWIESMGAKFEVTDERLIVRRGIFLKSIDEIELYRIKDVRMNFTLLNQLTGIGTICLTTSDETTRVGDLYMRHIGQAEARREELRRLVDAARRNRGVREIDMVHEDI
ncbi:MAG TPA: PH domain-containing protein [Croceibacterium sp.]|nr:PH domain-containing protein [Croceibacterium sp.]